MARCAERVDALVRGESTRRLVLGVGLAPGDVARQLRASVGLPDREGLLVRTVSDDSPAAVAGIKMGDLLIRAADIPLRSVDDLHRAMETARTTDELSVVLLRGTDEHTLSVSLAAAE